MFHQSRSPVWSFLIVGILTLPLLGIGILFLLMFIVYSLREYDVDTKNITIKKITGVQVIPIRSIESISESLGSIFITLTGGKKITISQIKDKRGFIDAVNASISSL